MPHFSYRAISDNGSQVNGSAIAASSDALRKELENQGLLVRDIRERLGWRARWGNGRVRPESFLAYTQELASLLAAGLNLREALEQTQDRPGEPRLAETISRVSKDVQGGMLFAQACARHPDVFDNLFLWALRTAERTGDLVGALQHYRHHAERRLALQRKFSQAMTYPVFLLVTLTVVLGVLFVFVLPRFAALYADLDTELPWATRLVIDAVHALPLAMPLLASLIIIVWVVYRKWTSSESGRQQADRVKERIPVIGPLRRELAQIHSARALSAFLAGGTPLVNSMRATAEALDDRAMAARLADAAQRVSDGDTLEQAARQTGLFPGKACRLIAVGEAGGNLAGVMENIADLYEGRVDRRSSRLIALIEPVLMLFIGVFIGGVIVVMYLPIFGMTEIIR